LDKVVAATSAIYMSNDRDALFKAINDSSTSFGFDYVLLACHKATRQEMVMNSAFTTIPQDFLTDYERLDWFDSDFNIGRVFDVDEGFFWDSSTDKHEDIQKQSFIDYLHANRMLTGLMTPIGHRPGTASVFSLICNTSKKLEPGTADAAAVVGNAALVKAEMLGLCPEISIDEATAVRLLTCVQLEMLNWIAEGKSNVDIGTIMNLNERTVRYHVSEILRKLGVATRMQAAAIRRSTAGDSRI